MVATDPARAALLAEREQMLRRPTVVPPIIFMGVGLLFTVIGGTMTPSIVRPVTRVWPVVHAWFSNVMLTP